MTTDLPAPHRRGSPGPEADTTTADPGRRRPRRGALIIAMAESIAHAHGGELRITSPRGGGLEVTVTLPLAETGEAGPARLPRAAKCSKG